MIRLSERDPVGLESLLELVDLVVVSLGGDLLSSVELDGVGRLERGRGFDSDARRSISDGDDRHDQREGGNPTNNSRGLALHDVVLSKRRALPWDDLTS